MYPSVVPETLIDFLQKNEQEFEHRAVMIDELQKNDQIVVLEGPFKGFEGLFEQFEGRQRSLVLLHFLGQQRQVRVPTRVLRAI